MQLFLNTYYENYNYTDQKMNILGYFFQVSNLSFILIEMPSNDILIQMESQKYIQEGNYPLKEKLQFMYNVHWMNPWMVCLEIVLLYNK